MPCSINCGYVTNTSTNKMSFCDSLTLNCLAIMRRMLLNSETKASTSRSVSPHWAASCFRRRNALCTSSFFPPCQQVRYDVQSHNRHANITTEC